MHESTIFHNMKYLSVQSMQPGYRMHKINWEMDFHGHIEGGLEGLWFG